MEPKKSRKDLVIELRLVINKMRYDLKVDTLFVRKGKFIQFQKRNKEDIG